MGGRTSNADSDATLSRRAMLAATAGLPVATSGCVREVRSIVNRDEIDQLSLTITTVSADGDRESIQLAREIAAVLEDVGMDISIDMQSREEFLRSVLINHDFDCYVGRHPGGTDPDFLYEALHSRYAEESGWQNPFGFTHLTFDDLLETQRAADTNEDRAEAVADVLETLALEQPFVPICVPEEYRLVRTDRFDGWGDGHPATRLGYLGLDPGEPDVERLRLVHTDARPSQNLNPLAVEYRNQGMITALLYDSLATASTDDGTLQPWLAEEWEWDDGTMTIELREDCSFHDGESLTADDVAFTYRFLSDTTLGEAEVPAPTQEYRGQIAGIDGIDVLDEHRLQLWFEHGEPAGERVLTVPILPEHVWTDRADAATVMGVRVAAGTTEALITDNIPPVGSGPFQFSNRTEREHVTLERFDDHFTTRSEIDLPEATVPELRIDIDPRSTSAIQFVDGNDADITSLPLESYVVDDVLESEADDTRVLQSPSRSFYHLGFNTRIAPFGDPRFRRIVARLVDKAWLVEDVFDGYARPIAVPGPDEWIPERLEWNGEDPETPFLGTDGDVDTVAARGAFEDAGFRHDGERLRVRR